MFKGFDENVDTVRGTIMFRPGEHACAFLGQGPALDAIERQDRLVGGETGEDCGGGELLRPADSSSQ